ncbi:SCO family protein [Enterovibrio coralii]|uniref:SCO family protein n=1 Tax=Enterovibrio coralii TaxID=294935 RepID=UPI0009F888F8|nr:SCO family protein [Enterovibrio coralii]
MRKLLSSSALLCALVSGHALANLDFDLQHATLGNVTEKSWPGQYLLIGIGYTSCPDICPTTVIDMAATVSKLGEKSSKVTPLFISVDPNRDTAEYMDTYVKFFSANMVGLVGNEEQTKQAMKSLRGTYGYSVEGKPVYPPLPEQYEVFHSAYVYLYSPEGMLVDVYGYGMGSDKIAADISRNIP